MNTADSAEEIVKIYLEGVEMSLRVTGVAAKNIAMMLIAMSKEKKMTRGKTRLTNMLKTGKPLKIFTISSDELKKFSQEAKKYGILYCALANKNNSKIDGMVDIMVRDEDAPRINRIVERFKLITIDTAQVQTIVQKSIDDRKEQRSHEKGVQTKTKEEMLEDVLSQKPIQKENNQVENFNSAMTVKNPQSELSSNKAEGVAKPLNRKKSVRKELKEIKEEVRKEAEKKSLVKDVKEVAPKVKAPKVKETR